MKEASGHYKATPEHPHHLSVGGVLYRDDGKICAHFFREITTHPAFRDLKNFYSLMRESPEDNEPLENTLHRGLKEEFGAEGIIETFLGGLESKFPSISGVEITKLTIYFLVRVTKWNAHDRDMNDAERESELTWLMPDELISKMREQFERLRRTDFEESVILERAKIYLGRLSDQQK